MNCPNVKKRKELRESLPALFILDKKIEIYKLYFSLLRNRCPPPKDIILSPDRKFFPAKENDSFCGESFSFWVKLI
ncbi:MAG TPA: hypothetical protein DCR31_05435 [Ruminococcaceae bacterium]|nr:hypothetical protein [Oscillospiraceae bacterium]